MEKKYKAVVAGGIVTGLIGVGYLIFGRKLPELPPANVVLSDLVISPAELYLGQSVTISVTATNIGETKGTATITCEVT